MPRTREYAKPGLAEFFEEFDEAACLRYLTDARWPTGFRCPGCQGDDGRPVLARIEWLCRSCGRQTSPTAGTALHRTRLPLATWFAGAYLLASSETGISALEFQSLLGLPRYETAWVLLHKLRRALGAANRRHLSGTIEVDQIWVGGPQAAMRQRNLKPGGEAVPVGIAVERQGRLLKRLRLGVLADATAKEMAAFIIQNVEPQSVVRDHAWPVGLGTIKTLGRLLSKADIGRTHAYDGRDPGVKAVGASLKHWLRDTHQGVGADHLDLYLDEYAFRFSRGDDARADFATIIRLVTSGSPVPLREIRPPGPESGPARRGRSTRLTSTKRVSQEALTAQSPPARPS